MRCCVDEGPLTTSMENGGMQVLQNVSSPPPVDVPRWKKLCDTCYASQLGFDPLVSRYDLQRC